MGRATILTEGKKRYAACIGGMVSVVGGKVNIVATTFEWADQIDLKRAEASYERASKTLNSDHASDTEIALAQARLNRSLVRKSVLSLK